MMKKGLFVIIPCLTALFAISCSSSSSGIVGSKFSPYYFYTDTSSAFIDINRHKLREFISFDKLTYKGSYLDDKPMTKDDLDNIKDNRNLKGIPAAVTPVRAFTTESLNMKLYPTDKIIHRGNKLFDSNQYTRVSAFSPVFILHSSKDKKFHYIMTEFMRGWIPADKVKIHSAAAFTGIQKMPFIRIIKDNTDIGGVIYGIGDKIPILSQSDNSVVAMTPFGSYISVPKNDSFVIGNAFYDEVLMKAMAESQLENPYDWGGRAGYRDCSAYVRDLWKVFGADIPRSSGLQVLVGKKLMDKPKNKDEFYAVLKNAKPYRTLIFFKGHVIMYGGMEKGDYIIYHAVNSLTDDKGVKRKLAKVAKNKLYEEKFSDIWKRVVRVTEISPLISPELPKEPELIAVDRVMKKIQRITKEDYAQKDDKK